MVRPRMLSLASMISLLVCGLVQAGTSALWGQAGELWDPRGRLPDFSWAGYESGESDIPSWPDETHVSEYGALPDDGIDDTWGIQQAILATEYGVVMLDAGVYDITAVIWISESNVAIRGHSQWSDGTILQVDRSMSETALGFDQDWGWGGGGFLFFEGKDPVTVTAVTEGALRGDRTLTVQSAAALSVGQHILLSMKDDASATLRKHLHNELVSTFPCSGDPKVLHENWAYEIERIEGNLVTLRKPLRMDVRTEWSPKIKKENRITNVGIEKVRIVFTDEPLMAKDPYLDPPDVVFIKANTANVLLHCPDEYPGPVCHHHELGYNGVYFRNVRDAWVRDVNVVHSDVGISIGRYSSNITVEDIRFYGRRGHHGVLFAHSDDNLLDTLYTSANWIHAVTMTHVSTGNVAKKLSSPVHVLHLDHHRNAPFENLICDSPDMDWNYDSGGNPCSGPHSAARETFWALQGPMDKPDWDHYQMNIIGNLGIPETLTDDGDWFEDVSNLEPADLHQSQLDRRLALDEPTVFDDDPIYGDRANWLERDPSRWRLDEYGDGKYRYVLHVGDFAILSGNRLGEWSVVPSETYEDVSIQCWAKTGESFATNSYADYALVLAWQDDLNYYAGLYNQVGTFTEIIKVVAGQKTSLSGAGTVNIADYKYHLVEFRHEGDQLTLLYDGVVVAQANDDTFSTGSVGVGANNDAARFDMFDVTCLTDCAGKACGDDGCGGSCGTCDDQNPCTDDSCPAGACVATANDAPCDDGDPCTVGDFCGMAVCQTGEPMDCGAGASCQDGACVDEPPDPDPEPDPDPDPADAGQADVDAATMTDAPAGTETDIGPGPEDIVEDAGLVADSTQPAPDVDHPEDLAEPEPDAPAPDVEPAIEVVIDDATSPEALPATEPPGTIGDVGTTPSTGGKPSGGCGAGAGTPAAPGWALLGLLLFARSRRRTRRRRPYPLSS